MAVSLFDPIKLGAIEAPNRIIMAPLTRGRAGPGFVPNELAVEYYRQRASAGLIISEATGISQEGLGWPSAPGLWTDAQVEGWKPVTDAVHAAGGRIIAQLWHMGRLVHSVFNDGKQPVSASATQGEGRAHTPVGRRDLEVARPLELNEIPRLIADYAKAAENAKRAGFDGVQLHGANGYLIDQFLRSTSNQRTDAYGGSRERRLRFLQEVVNAVAEEIGAERVGVRLAPFITGKKAGKVPGRWAAVGWAFALCLIPALLAKLLPLPFPTETLLVSVLLLFGAVFAVNSSLHSYLIVSYAKTDGVSLDVGFYYMANAMGRLIGTVLSGYLYQTQGLEACLFWSSGFILATVVLSCFLPKAKNEQPK